MADSKITDYTAETSPAGTDLVEVVVDPAGTPANRKVTITNLLAVGGDPGTIETVDGAVSGSVATSANAGTDDAEVLATVTTVGGGTGTISLAASATEASVGIGFTGGQAIEAYDDGAVHLGFFGATAVIQQTFDSGLTDTARIAALEAIVAALGLAVDTA